MAERAYSHDAANEDQAVERVHGIKSPPGPWQYVATPERELKV